MAVHGTGAAIGFQLYLMARPPHLPERMIAAAPDAFFGHFLDIRAHDPGAVPADIRAACRDARRDAVPSIAADYRASAGADARTRRGRSRALPVSTRTHV